MALRPLGKTGLMVEGIGLGTYPLTGAVFVKGTVWEGPQGYGAVSPEQAKATIEKALALGVNFVDTAPVYGQAEDIVGLVRSEGRWSFIVETKAGEYIAEDGTLTRDFSEQNIRRSVLVSKRRLQMDVLDILLLHTPDPEEFGDGEPLNALCKLKEEGDVRFIGSSCRDDPGDALSLIQTGKVDVLQFGFNLIQPRMMEVFEAAKEHGVGIVIRTPLASGFLTGLISEDYEFPQDDYRSKIEREVTTAMARQAAAFRPLVDGREIESLPELALRYILSFDAVSVVIPGAVTPEEVERNVAAARKGPLPDALLEEIERIQRNLGLL
ncbi:MAG: aldo/keto reductase [Armatimonadetes bacterium]|nr:aldo/keto reductase [Armatimonadota bacterium]MDW8121745.1 aldo/keto reductase [Armatimonadota bacterium]